MIVNRVYLQLRIICNKAWEWMGRPVGLVFWPQQPEIRTNGAGSMATFHFFDGNTPA
jgi:hypothetical protein